MKLTPSREEFKELAKNATLVAVSANVSTDLDTPVSAFYKLVNDDKGFLLESVDAHQKFGRYSFIGADPFIMLQIYKDKLLVQENDKMRAFNGGPVASMNT